MTTNISSSLIGLSILSGTDSFQTMSGALPTVETAAERAAKALFTAPPTTAPWQQDSTTSTLPDNVQLSSVLALKSVVDPANNQEAAGSDDVETSFVAYKALDRLRILANAATQTTTSDATRASLQAAFAKGLSDLEGFLAQAPGNQLSLSFGNPSTSITSTGVMPTQDIGTVAGNGVLTDHSQPVPGVTGNEVMTIHLASGSHHDDVTVDLSTTPQPPTLDSIAKAFNDAIASVPVTDSNGVVLLDSQGNPVPRYDVSFAVTRGDDGKYGLTMDSDGSQVSISQNNAADSLMVVDSQTQFDSPTGAQIYRYDDTSGSLVRQTLGNISATDQQATDKAALSDDGSTSSTGTDTTTTTGPAPIPASLTAQASATSADGYTYVVGTTSGTLGTHLSDGGDDLFLSKVDSEGNIVWQQTLGVAGTAQGAAVSIGADGSVVVAGSVTGPFDGSLGSNSDMLVAKFDASGEKQFATSIASTGDDTATAVAVGADGSIYLGGKSAGTGGGAAYIAHMDASGKMIQQRVIDTSGTDSVSALAIDGSGNLLALTRENGQSQLRSLSGTDLTSDVGSVSLGTADARAIAVGADSSIAVAGATTSALPDNASYNAADGRDGFVTRINADLSGATTTYVGAAGDDQIDSVAFMGSDIYVGGRTTSALGGNLSGKVDGFVAHIDGTTGSVAGISQFGGTTAVADAVHVSTLGGGSSILGAIGLHQGVLNSEISTSLASQAGLQTGDSFSLQVDGGAVHKITIADGETMTSLAQKIRDATGTNITITTPQNDAGQSQLEFLVAQGHTLGLLAGPDGSDALPKLGLEPTRIHSDPVRGPKDPVVTPGGSYGLSLSTALSIGNATDAKAALDAVTSAISLTQTAYRSLYWDDSKAQRVNGTIGAGSAHQQAQLASYTAALQRLSAGTNSLSLL